MGVYMHVCTFVPIYIFPTHTYIFAYKYHVSGVRVVAYMHAYMHACIHTYKYHVFGAKVVSYMHAFIHTYIHTYKQTYLHTNIMFPDREWFPTFIHTYIRMYMHTYTHIWEQSPLHMAAIKGQIAMIQKLLVAGAEIDLRDKEGRTPLLGVYIYISYTYEYIYMHIYS